MAVVLFSIVLIINLVEALYLTIRIFKLKQADAPDRAYKQMIDRLAPFLIVSMVISIVFIIIALMVS
ncbi:hypothetical protein [Staphylococcus edaphicus]|uniref:Uncharacterized protein n=1 Tax=Staphylococcus edaphicus TaxID=1955013 RepID=A0A2C6WMQ3_9STAP|nr:hypothetical protein [Staphylococcus edaphicus]PHK49036.1 hypothetical protein BTJ66_10450 [Staphylococcus edaphicus]UQW81361.1 hypothetical protein MNY58_12500 [Staphylococcus edaphicus]